MKQNLWTLLGLIVLVAVAVQFSRGGAKKAEWVALERDLQASLELLWQQPGQKAELVPAEGGPMALVTVRMPPQAKASWNVPFLHFVATRHPEVHLKRLDLRDALSGNPIASEDFSSVGNWFLQSGPSSGDSQRRAELLRRQGQSVVDEQLGAGQGLVLVDLHQVAATESRVPVNVHSALARPMEAAPEAQRESARKVESAEGMYHDQAASPPPPQFQVQTCVVLATPASAEKLALIRLKLTSGSGDELRVVNLPPR